MSDPKSHRRDFRITQSNSYNFFNNTFIYSGVFLESHMKQKVEIIN